MWHEVIIKLAASRYGQQIRKRLREHGNRERRSRAHKRPFVDKVPDAGFSPTRGSLSFVVRSRDK